MKRWPLLENNPTLRGGDWLPSASVWPELGDLRAEHERLLAAEREAGDRVGAVHRRHEAEDAAYSEALRQSYLSGGDAEEPAPETSPDERAAEVAAARLRWEAATDALVEFLESAIAELAERAPSLYEALDTRAAEADDKRREAARLLGEADRHVRNVERMRRWLDRESGRSALGHFPFDQMPLPPAVRDFASGPTDGLSMEVTHV